MPLLYICAQWHALAKLRLHNDFTLALLEYTTAQLGAKMRVFDKYTCRKTPTKELKGEADVRARREVQTGKGQGSSTPRSKQFSIYTIKFHFLGDYPDIIRRFGTTDSYSTQIVSCSSSSSCQTFTLMLLQGELYHRSPKSWYSRTDRKDYETQLSQAERHQARLRQIRSEIDPQPSSVRSSHSEGGPQLGPSYVIGTSKNCPIYLDYFRTPPNQESACWAVSLSFFPTFCL